MHLSTWKIESSRERSERILFHRSESNIERLRSHVYTNNSFNVYVTQVKSREEKNYSVQSHSTFSSCASLFHHIFLCAMNDNHWVRERSSTYVTITSITNAKKTSFIFESRIESGHRCIEYHQWRAEQRRCVINEQHRHSLRVYSSVTRWIEAIGANLIHSLMVIVSTTWSRRVDGEWFSPPESFVHSI